MIRRTRRRETTVPIMGVGLVQSMQQQSKNMMKSLTGQMAMPKRRRITFQPMGIMQPQEMKQFQKQLQSQLQIQKAPTKTRHPPRHPPEIIPGFPVEMPPGLSMDMDWPKMKVRKGKRRGFWKYLEKIHPVVASREEIGKFLGVKTKRRKKK